eukprot:GGOE01000298.1.p1 GENE.GGOE01000298.1~~GGOE01000298.1.p1  ORF type:complete len:522 (-),score=69.66 GGOE01000298.1:158-1603(-)
MAEWDTAVLSPASWTRSKPPSHPALAARLPAWMPRVADGRTPFLGAVPASRRLARVPPRLDHVPGVQIATQQGSKERPAWLDDDEERQRMTGNATRHALRQAGNGRCSGTAGWYDRRLVDFQPPLPFLHLTERVQVALAPPTPKEVMDFYGEALPGTERLNREWHQVFQGLHNHPAVNLTVLPLSTLPEQLHPFDWLVLLTPDFVSSVNISWILSRFTRRTIVIDFSDHRVCGSRYQWYDIPPYRSLVYFKRAFIEREGGKSVRGPNFCPLNVAPMHYAIFDQWIFPRTFPWHRRPWDVVCTLRARESSFSPSSGGRWAVMQWLKGIRDSWPFRMSLGPITRSSDNCIDEKYLRLLHSAKVVVTCQPAHWETDFRTWEAMASGALVFVDAIVTPLPFAPVDKVHWVVYNPFDERGFLRTLRHYLDNPEEAAAIARAGQLHALQHHRTVSRMDHVLWTATINKTRTMVLGTLRVRRRTRMGH